MPSLGRADAGTAREFRPEIEGLRAVAALLVASYHVWFGRVSGGVDVFFVISGYLVTESLLGRAERGGSLDLSASGCSSSGGSHRPPFLSLPSLSSPPR